MAPADMTDEQLQRAIRDAGVDGDRLLAAGDADGFSTLLRRTYEPLIHERRARVERAYAAMAAERAP